MFKDHIIASGQQRKDWADLLKISTSYLSLLEAGRKTPSLDLAVRIERATNGAVSATSWIADENLCEGESEAAE